MRTNPFHSYRGFRYYTAAGVYRLSLPDGSKEAFGAKRGGLHALQNYVDAYIDELAADQSLARNPRPVTPRRGSARPKYPLDLRENPLSGRAGLHIVAKRRAPHKRGEEYSFSYSTRVLMTGIGVTPSGRTYATRKYGEDWKADAEDFLSEYDDGYYADATLKIFARDDQGVDHPLTLSAVRSMAESGILPAHRATNPRHR